MPALDLSNPALPADAVIAALGLAPHPEGGHYRETWRDSGRAPAPDGGRGAGTAILFLLAAGEVSHWHRVDAAELWIWQSGAPLSLGVSRDGMARESVTLGPVLPGQCLQYAIAPHHWQAAASLGAWTLVSCVVAPAFSFDGFELAPPGWAPGSGNPA